MNSDKFSDVSKLLAEFNFHDNKDVPDDVKCLKCRKILINAYLGPCECQLCRVCIDDLLKSGCRFCPGNTDECKESNLSNFSADYRTQRKISKLIVNCPEEMCTFKSELINMNEHLRVCPMKSVKCVFYGLGCDQSNVAAAKMDEHLQLSSYSHMEMLMGVIDNMRNEIDRLKENDETNKNEIAILKRDSMIKTERIELLNEEIKLMKEEKIYDLEKEVWKTVTKMNAGLSDMRQEWKAALDNNEAASKETNVRYQADMETRMSTVETRMHQQISGTFFWAINNIEKERKNKKDCVSGDFFAQKMPYKLTLGAQLNGDSDCISFVLVVYPDSSYPDLQWPFDANVTITIRNNASPGVWRSVRKHLKYPKLPEHLFQPLTELVTVDKHVELAAAHGEIGNCCSCGANGTNDDGDYRTDSRWKSICKEFDENIAFNFLYCDLSNAALLIGDSFIVECHVDVRD